MKSKRLILKRAAVKISLVVHDAPINKKKLIFGKKKIFHSQPTNKACCITKSKQYIIEKARRKQNHLRIVRVVSQT